MVPVDNSLPICPRLLRQITLWSHCSGEVITRGSTLSACGDAAACCGAGRTNGAFRGTAHRSSAGLAPQVEHRSPTVKRMDHVHLWVYGNTGADESGIPNSLLHNRFLTRRMDMVPREPRLAVRRRRKVVVVLAVSIALALSGLGIESASAYTWSRLALSLKPDRSNAVRLDGSAVKGQIYVFVRNAETLDKVDFYLDSWWRTKPPVRTDTEPPLSLIHI